MARIEPGRLNGTPATASAIPTTAGSPARRRGAGVWWALAVTAPLLLGGPSAAAAGPSGLAAPPDDVTAPTEVATTTPTPTPTPTGTRTVSPDPSSPQPAPSDPTSTPAPTPSPTTSTTTPQETTDSPTSEEPVDPTTTPAPTPDEPSEPSQAPTTTPAPVIEPIPPAATTSNQSAVSWIIAIAVLAASGLVLVMLRRRAARTSPDEVPGTDEQLADVPGLADTVPLPVTPGTPSQTAPTEPLSVTASPAAPPAAAPHPTAAAVTFAAIEAIGEGMLDATYSVITIESALEDIARVNAYPSTGVVVMPTALFVSTRGAGELYTGAVSSGRNKLLLHQVDALDELVRAARAGEMTPTQILSGMHDIRTAPPPFSRGVRIAAYVLLCAGIAVILGGSWTATAIACVLGTFVGAARLLTADVSRQREPLVTVALAFGVSTAVFLLARVGWDHGVLASLIAPLVILLPGALLTTGIIELAAGQMLSGAGRLMAGFMQLVLLAVGIVAGAALVGVPRLVLSESHQPIGAIAPWIAVAAFGVGVVIHQGGRRDSIPWILLVLYVAYGAQVIGEIFFGGVLSALIGAFVMTPVAVLVSRNPTGPAASVSFLPAFWLLVPGALGLVGVASILGGDRDGGSTIITTMFTMVAIALGILAGSALGARSKTTGRDVL